MRRLLERIHEAFHGPRLLDELERLKNEGHPWARAIHEVHTTLIEQLEEMRRKAEERGDSRTLQLVDRNLRELKELENARLGREAGLKEILEEFTSSRKVGTAIYVRRYEEARQNQRKMVEEFARLYSMAIEALQKRVEREKISKSISRLLSRTDEFETDILFLANTHKALLRALVEMAKQRGR